MRHKAEINQNKSHLSLLRSLARRLTGAVSFGARDTSIFLYCQYAFLSSY